MYLEWEKVHDAFVVVVVVIFHMAHPVPWYRCNDLKGLRFLELGIFEY